jgi:hypothetical protein
MFNIAIDQGGWSGGHALDLYSGVLGSNFGRDIGYPDLRFFVVFLSSPRQIPV